MDMLILKLKSITKNGNALFYYMEEKCRILN